MNPQELRASILASLPAQTSTSANAPPQVFHLPFGHFKVLEPQANIVSGGRGAGKTFWAAMLTNNTMIANLVTIEPSLSGFSGVTGFAERSAIESYPDERTFRQLLQQGVDAEDIWLGVVVRNVAAVSEEEVPSSSWPETVTWVATQPEKVARLLEAADASLEKEGFGRLYVFDALDRTARDWASMDLILKGLLRLVLRLRSFGRLRAKVFLRDDQLTRAVSAFPDASKLTATMVELHWQAHDLHALLWQYLINGPGAEGEWLRGLYEETTGLPVRRGFERYVVGPNVQRDSRPQRALFEALAGKSMGRDHRRGVPYVWIVSHLSDALRRASPRSFLAAIREAAEDSLDRYPDYELPLHYESIKRGVQSASRIRVQEIAEDFPWVRTALEALGGLSVPCVFEQIESRWTESFPNGLPQDAEATGAFLPPPHGSSWKGVAGDLERLGIFETMSDGRVNMPDLYRVGFGLGRRGGVRPTNAPR
ncbi:MAG TPA: hypothetical protein PK095_03975 [Myxococcota bacterium]|nr:hypothetical protein [Myxococcota bacterium]